MRLAPRPLLAMADAAHDPTVSYGHANEELATRTGQMAFGFGRQADRAVMGYLLGRISRNRSWPVSRLLISALVRYQGEADAGPGFFNLAREVGLVRGSLSDLDRLEFWLLDVRQVQAFDWDQAPCALGWPKSGRPSSDLDVNQACETP